MNSPKGNVDKEEEALVPSTRIPEKAADNKLFEGIKTVEGLVRQLLAQQGTSAQSGETEGVQKRNLESGDVQRKQALPEDKLKSLLTYFESSHCLQVSREEIALANTTMHEPQFWQWLVTTALEKNRSEGHWIMLNDLINQITDGRISLILPKENAKIDLELHEVADVVQRQLGDPIVVKKMFMPGVKYNKSGRVLVRALVQEYM